MAAGVPGSLSAQTADRCLGPAVTLQAGADFAAGGFHRFFWGTHYRPAWTAEIFAEELDLGRFAGGMTPISAGGGLQTRSLWLTGANGKPYSFRSVYKRATELLPEVFRGTFVEDVVQDQMSSQFPGGALVADSILAVVGVPHTRPILCVLPAGPGLGEFSAEFAGVLGVMQERPVDTGDEFAAFAGAEDVLDTDALLEIMQATPAERPDAVAYMRARQLDMLFGDWDRHADQWRWARFADGGTRWAPIPRDRDQAFARFDGVVLGIARGRIPALSSFGPKYGNIRSLHFNARFLDRHFLAELDRAQWDSVAVGLSSRITDETIDGAVGRLPAGILTAEGDRLSHDLKLRRDALPEASTSLYELLAREASVQGTDAAEVADVTRTGEWTVRVTVREAGSPEPYFDREFHTSDTKEIRLDLHGGDDRVVVSGGDLPIKVRILGGPGDDFFEFAEQSGNVRLYDHRGANAVRGGDAPAIDDRPYPDAPLIPSPGSPPPPRHFDGFGFPNFLIGYSPDFFFYAGGGYTWYDYGFRKDPYASRVSLNAAVATRGRARADLDAEFRFENSSRYIPTRGLASSAEILNFYGIGNDASVPDGVSNDFFDVQQLVVQAEAGVGWTLSEETDLKILAIGAYRDTKDDPNTLAGQIDDLYGAGVFGSVAAIARFRTQSAQPDIFERVANTTHFELVADASVVPALMDVQETYGTIAAVGTAGIPIPLRRSEIALRLGGELILGDAPFFDLAYIGGGETVRGFFRNRFAGDASLYGGAELRLDLFDYSLIFPSTFGVLGLVDTGRVWVDGDSPGGFNTGFGGGIWLAIRGTRSVLSVAFAGSESESGLYITMGFAY